jgi:release factor glutamine methyltransferase
MATEVAALLAEGSTRLARITDQAQREAEILLGAALDRSRAWLLAHLDERILDCDATDRYEAYVTRRAHREPIAYILGEKEFWSLTLAVTPDVLIPRPETELVVELALRHLPRDTPARVLDLATGSGAIALAIAHERSQAGVVGTDLSPAALEVARRNAMQLHLTNVTFAAGHWFEAVAGQPFDVIVSNPPYIADGDPRVEPGVRRFEPGLALFAGQDGLDALRAVVHGAAAHLLPEGWLVVEHGDQQGPAVRALFESTGFIAIATHRDLAGLDRCTEGRRTARPGA